MHHRKRGIKWHKIDCPHAEIRHCHPFPENGQKIEASVAETDTAIRFMSPRGVKSILNLSNLCQFGHWENLAPLEMRLNHGSTAAAHWLMVLRLELCRASNLPWMQWKMNAFLYN